MSGLWTRTQTQYHINSLEMMAVHNVFTHWKDIFVNDVILVGTDNSTVVAYLNKQGGTVSRNLCLLARRLLLWAAKYNIIVRARHIPGRLNAIADGLSRKNQIVATEWSLCPQMFKELSHQMGGHWIDLFATRHNNKISCFISPVPDPPAWEVDALATLWEGM